MELENPNFLPEEISIEIFSRLPAKAVGRCRCLSKTWHIQLSTSQFVNLHTLNRRTNTENLLLNNAVDHSLHIIDAPIVDNTAVSRKLELGVAWSRVLGSCNGLVLLSNTDEELFLVNPITQQHFKLPPLPLGLDDIVYTPCGLGYDSLSDDYKVVAFTYCSVFLHLGYNRIMNVYSVKSGAWKRVGDSQPHDCSAATTMHGRAFVNGAIHWYYIRKNTDDSDKLECVIGVFDLAGDVFHEFPASPLRVSHSHIMLLVLEGCLCMSTLDDSDNIEIWMMKQYGLTDSWTKFTIATNSELRVNCLLCSIGDSEIVFLSDDDTVVVYNLREGTTKVTVVDGVSVACLEGVAFLDSLASPNHLYSN